MKQFYLILGFLLITSYSFAQPANYYMNPTFGSDGVFSPAASSNIVQRSFTASSTNSTFYIEWDGQFNEWYNNSINFNEQFTLTFDANAGLNNTSTLNTQPTIGKHYTLQINGYAYSDRIAVLMETDNAPINFAGSNPITPSSPTVFPGQDLVVTVTLSGNKSSQEKVFIRYSTDGFSSSEVVEASIPSTGSTGTATIPASVNTAGTNVSFYAYSTTVAATSSSNHDLIALRLENNGGSNYSYTVQNTWTTNTGATDWTTAASWDANEVPPANAPITIQDNLNLNTDISTSSLTIETGTTLTINSTHTLNISGQIGGDGDLNVSGTLSILDGGFTLITPTYSSGGTLQYKNIVADYDRFNEWTDASTLGAGAPDNVIIDNSVLDLTNGSQSSMTDFYVNNNLNLINGGTIRVDKNENLDVGGNVDSSGGTLTLNSDSDEYSSLIVVGSVTGNVTYSRHVNDYDGSNATTIENSNDLISSPTGISDVAAFLSGNGNFRLQVGTPTVYAFAPFDNTTTGLYQNMDSDDTGALTNGKGYRAATSSPNSNINFTGAVATSQVDVGITVGGASNGTEAWNLIGNPYPSFIDFQAFFDENKTEFASGAFQAIYGYNATASRWTIWNQATIDDLGVTERIAPGQGFFVNSKTGGGTVSFTAAMRTKEGSNDFIVAGESQNNTVNVARADINLNVNNSDFSTIIYFNSNATRNLDPGYDAGAYLGDANGIFTHLVEGNTGIELAMQSLPYEDFNDITIPLGVKSTAGQQINFSLMNSSLPAGIKVYLEDTAENTVTDLTLGNYILTPSNDLTGVGRFNIIFSNATLSNNELDFNALNIITDHSNKMIKIIGELEVNTEISLFDLQGRLVISTEIDTIKHNHVIDVNGLNAGVYLVQLTQDAKKKTEKIILK